MKLMLPILFMCLSAIAQDLGNPSSLAMLKGSGGGGGAPSFPQSGNVQYHYALDEASGNRAATLGGVDLVQSGGTITSAAGIKGNAADLGSATTATLSAGENIQNSAGYTMAFWFKPAGIPASTAHLCGDYVSAGSVIYLNTGDLIFTSEEGGWGSLTFGGAINIGSWNLIVVAHDGVETARSSLNGAAANTATGALGSSFVNTVVGASSAYGADGYGLVDELTIWNVVLSNSEISTLYNGGAGLFYTP